MRPLATLLTSMLVFSTIVTVVPTTVAADEVLVDGLRASCDGPSDSLSAEHQEGVITPDYNITVVGGSLPFDPNVTMARVQELLDRNVSVSITIVIRMSNDTDPEDDGPDYNKFRRMLGFGSDTFDGNVTTNSFVLQSADSTAIRTENLTIYVPKEVLANPQLAERGLAHEFTHAIQHVVGQDRPFDATVDRSMTWRSKVEGMAEYVEWYYWKRYLDTESDPLEDLRTRYLDGTVAERRFLSPYFYGWNYFEARANGIEGIWQIYQDWPNTTEELLHRLPPNSEPPAELNVSVQPGRFFEHNRTTMGELYLRIVLSGQMNRSAAAHGASGWGTDTRIILGDGDGELAFAWIHRWDDRPNASTFADAFRQFLDGRAQRQEDRWQNDEGYYRFIQLSDRTTVVLMGSEAFVENTTVSIDDNAVRINPPVEQPRTQTAGPASPSSTSVSPETANDTASERSRTETIRDRSPGLGIVPGVLALLAVLFMSRRRV